MSSVLFFMITSLLSVCLHFKDVKENQEIINDYKSIYPDCQVKEANQKTNLTDLNLDHIENNSSYRTVIGNAAIPSKTNTDIPPEVDFVKPVNMEEMDHSIWDGLLKKYVTQGKVDYRAWHRNQNELNSYIAHLSSNHPKASWSRNAKLAYWINAYNAFTIKLILDHYPVKSIMDIHEGKPWDVVWIRIGDKTYSLNQIEHEIIRPQFGEPRIHFAVNCAAVSCPPLGNTAFSVINLDNLLDKQTRDFIGNKQMNHIEKNKLEISQIFEWYREDFTSLISFIQQYTSISIEPGAKILFKEYDWSLNGI